MEREQWMWNILYGWDLFLFCFFFWGGGIDFFKIVTDSLWSGICAIFTGVVEF